MDGRTDRRTDKSVLEKLRCLSAGGAKKLNFFNTKVDDVMHKLPADYVINLGYTNQNRLMDLQRPSFVPSFMDN